MIIHESVVDFTFWKRNLKTKKQNPEYRINFWAVNICLVKFFWNYLHERNFSRYSPNRWIAPVLEDSLIPWTVRLRFPNVVISLRPVQWFWFDQLVVASFPCQIMLVNFWPLSIGFLYPKFSIFPFHLIGCFVPTMS